MAESLDKTTVDKTLAELGRRDQKRRHFGSSEHDYKLNPPISVAVIEEFETRHGIRLPEDYRYFLTEIGNGGAGPHYGLFPLGYHDDSDGLRSWEGGDLVGDLSQPFPYKEAWNLPESFWDQEPNIPPDLPPEEEDRLWEAWDKLERKHYWNPEIMNGAIPICHIGCALRQWLVINGEQRGFIWDDMRADNAGLAPLKDSNGTQVTFSGWYLAWLNESLNNTPLRGLAPQQSRQRDLLVALLLIAAGALLGVIIALIRN